MDENELKIVCHGLCPGDSGVETPIPCNIAREEYGICIRHGKLQTNGELRFRLRCEDGSAYIRTQTSNATGGWQNAHYHKYVRETYIVEKGWIGYILIVDDKTQYKRHKAGDLFTTIPNVAHNIYMPKNSIIHTVKHNAEENQEKEQSDWHDDTDDCRQIMEVIGSSFPSVLECDTSVEGFSKMRTKNPYSAGYRHFDNLIWQVPAWATAIFAAIIAISAFLLGQNPNEFVLGDNFSPIYITALMLILFGVLTLILSYALYRFRWHQTGIKNTHWPESEHYVISPQSLLQVVVMFEGWFMIMGAGFLIQYYYFIELSVAFALLIGFIFCFWEHTIKVLRSTGLSTIDHEDYSYLKQRAS